MVSRCFNGRRAAPFRYLQDGKVFRLEPEGIVSTIEPEYFWLCNRCAATMTLGLDERGDVVVAPTPIYEHSTDGELPFTLNRSNRNHGDPAHPKVQCTLAELREG